MAAVAVLAPYSLSHLSHLVQLLLQHGGAARPHPQLVAALLQLRGRR